MGYEALAQEALRGVVKLALERVVQQGLPGDHHFYVTFDTSAPGVGISEWLKGRYPEEMTIVLQNQFWGLKVRDEAFEVTLSFQKSPETLVVPWAAIKVFFDPSVQFMLQFKPGLQAPGGQRPKAAPTAAPVKPPAAPKPETPADPPKDPVPPGGGAVVSLDKFRKK